MEQTLATPLVTRRSSMEQRMEQRRQHRAEKHSEWRTTKPDEKDNEGTGDRPQTSPIASRMCYPKYSSLMLPNSIDEEHSTQPQTQIKSSLDDISPLTKSVSFIVSSDN